MLGIKGFCLENGMFFIGEIVTSSIDKHYEVTALLQLVLDRDAEGNTFTTFSHLNPFVNEKKLDTITYLNREKVVFVFEVDADIVGAYNSSLSKLIVPEPQSIIMPR